MKKYRTMYGYHIFQFLQPTKNAEGLFSDGGASLNRTISSNFLAHILPRRSAFFSLYPLSFYPSFCTIAPNKCSHSLSSPIKIETKCISSSRPFSSVTTTAELGPAATHQEVGAEKCHTRFDIDSSCIE